MPKQPLNQVNAHLIIQRDERSDCYFTNVLWPEEENYDEIKSKSFGDVDAALANLRSSLSSLTDMVLDWDDYSKSQRKELVKPIKRAGFTLLTGFFNDQAEKFLAQVKERKINSISVRGVPNLDIPFDMMTGGENEKWLGEFALCRPALKNRTRENDEIFQSDEFAIPIPNSTLSIGYADDNSLQSAGIPEEGDKEKEQGAIEQLKPHGVEIERCPELVPTDDVREEHLHMFSDWLHTPRPGLHFNCHSQLANVGANDVAPIQVTDKFFVPSGEVLEKQLLPDTRVFLNLCNAGIGRHDSKKSLTYMFYKNGAKIAIGPSFEVPDSFATRFAYKFYENLTSGDRTYFEALHRTRVELTKEFGHPMALVYSYVGGGEARLFDSKVA